MLTQKDYCDYYSSVALKELGYDELCEGYYHLTDDEDYNQLSFELCYGRDFQNSLNRWRAGAPLLYEAQKWLREEKGIYIEIPTSFMDNGVWKFSFRLQTREFYDRAIGEWDSYEEALSEGIKGAIKILKEK